MWVMCTRGCSGCVWPFCVVVVCDHGVQWQCVALVYSGSVWHWCAVAVCGIGVQGQWDVRVQCKCVVVLFGFGERQHCLN